MSSFLKNLPIRRKLTLVILAASMGTLLLASISLYVFQLVRARQQIIRDLKTSAEIIAANSTAAAAFDDTDAAQEILRSLKAKPHIICAGLYRPDRKLLAHFGPAGDQDELPPDPIPDGYHFHGEHLVLFQPVTLEGRREGTIYLRFNYREMQREVIGPYLAILGGTLLASALVSLLLSSQLQRVISRPLLRLAETARAIADQQDYSVRAPDLGQDELGTLTAAFNQMLGRIQNQDLALRDSERRYRLLFERNPVPMFVYDLQSLAFLAVNDAAVAHYGFTREELLAMTVKDIRPPEDVPALLARLSAGNGAPTRTGQSRHRKRDGTVIEVETTAHRIEILGRAATLLLALDVTERKQAEQALKQSQQRYEIAVLGSNDGLWDWDITGNAVYFSPRWKRMIGYEDDEFPNRVGLWEERIHPEDAPRVFQNYEDYLAGRSGQYEIEYRLRHKDGSYRWILSRGVALRDPEGKPLRMAGSHTDITARKQAEAALQQRFEVEKLISELSTRFINLAPGEIDQGISRALEMIGRFIGADLAHVLRFENDLTRISATHEWSATGITARSPELQNVPMSSAPWCTEQLRQLKPLVVPDVSALPASDAQYFASSGFHALLAAPMQFGGQLRGMLGAVNLAGPRLWRDSEVTLIQLAAQIFTNALERRTAHEQLEALHDQMLEVSRKSGMAEVAAGVLHNVGNVLNSVNVSACLARDRLRQSRVPSVAKLAGLFQAHQHDLADFLSRDPRGTQIPVYLPQLAQHLEEEQTKLRDELDLLVRNVEHIKQIVSMQQNYARVAGVIETLPISVVVEDALRITEAGLLRHGISLTRDFAAVPPVPLNRHKVLQILVNLLRNARQAIEEAGQRTGSITLRIREHGAECVCVEVEDDGVGIENENLTRIFSHGFTTKQEGHGFGLHSGALAADEMGGRLSVHSAGRGHGATFILELPISPPTGRSHQG